MILVGCIKRASRIMKDRSYIYPIIKIFFIVLGGKILIKQWITESVICPPLKISCTPCVISFSLIYISLLISFIFISSLSFSSSFIFFQFCLFFFNWAIGNCSSVFSCLFLIRQFLKILCLFLKFLPCKFLKFFSLFIASSSPPFSFSNCENSSLLHY